ncbi:Polymerase/histidinol phosphatase-like protein [Phlyctochytrium arcticum]|nr:Polymerase/histidinol phosphatase-like protein [Phlyctochytrium arcticum]
MLSLHSHSGEFCLHASDTLEECVQRAIALKFRVFGLSEHVPRSRVQDLYPEEEHLTPADLNKTFTNYVVVARALQSKYKDQIRLLVGAETEYIHETSLQDLVSLRKETPLDYVVGSVHHVQGHPIDFDLSRLETAENHLGGTEALFLAYFDAQYEMLRHIKPEVVGHFDLIRMFRPSHPLSNETWSKIKRNVREIKASGGLVEINSRAWKKGLPSAYPLRDILEYMIEEEVNFTLSDDSHGPKDVGMHYDKLVAYLKEMNINRVWFITESGAVEAMDIDLDRPLCLDWRS